MRTTSWAIRACAGAVVAAAAAVAPVSTAGGEPGAGTLVWRTVVDDTYEMPGAPGRLFNSYNQPSVNADGVVVFRARSRGPNAMHGIYVRDMGDETPIVKVMDRATAVPQPNNRSAVFVEFPSFPRIDMSSSAVVSRGQSPPVWEYALGDGTTTVAGTSGVFTTAEGSLQTGVSTLGAVPGFESLSVPGVTPVTRFEVFPGAPSITDGTLVVFKGNYTEDGEKKTGAFYRDLAKPDGPVVRLAATGTPMSGGRKATLFGEVGPPTAAGRKAVFAGWDDEANPTAGGIFMTDLTSRPKPEALVTIGSKVPGGPAGSTFRQLGDAVAFDGRYVAFWGSWGSETRSVTLTCPDEGNAERLAYCLEHDDGAVREVPVHQGVFVYDTVLRRAQAVATTGKDILDFTYWNYSGHPPGNGEGEESHEPPAWRSAAFFAVSSTTAGYDVAFEASKTSGVDGVYLAAGPRQDRTFRTVAETGTEASTFDAGSPDGSVVTAIGIEREGLRNGWLAVNVSMATSTTEEGTAGIYVARLRGAAG